MLVWLCSFEPGDTRKAMCPAFILQWPIFCLRLANGGFPEMMEHAGLHRAKAKSGHFIHALLEIEAGIPYAGPLTNWHDATLAQRTLFGTQDGAYPIQVKRCYFLESPISVFTHMSGQGEAILQLRPSNMAFELTSVEKPWQT